MGAQGRGWTGGVRYALRKGDVWMRVWVCREYMQKVMRWGRIAVDVEEEKSHGGKGRKREVTSQQGANRERACWS